MKNKKLFIIIGAVLFVAIVSCVLFFALKNSSSATDNTLVDVVVGDNIKIKENVVIHSEKTSKRKRPFAVEENYLLFSKNPGYEENTIIISDITEVAPVGYLRKVVSTEKVEENYLVYTESAQLTDVFEELTLSATVQLTENENGNLEVSESNAQLLSITPKMLLSLTSKSGTKTKTSDEDNKYELFKVEFDKVFNYDLEKNISISGKIEAIAWLDIKIDITKGQLKSFELTLNDETDGDILFGFGAASKYEGEKEIFNKDLKPLTIMAGPIPIVISNSVSAKLSWEATLLGGVGLKLNLDSTAKNGFVYSSADKNFKEICENKVTNDKPIDFVPSLSGDIDTEAAVSLAVTPQFFDSLGIEIGVGIKGELEGELTVYTNTIKTDEVYYGKIELSVFPFVEGSVVGDIPILDKDLFDIKLFNFEFKPLWKKEWSNVHPLKQKNAYELLGVTYKEIVDCFGTDYTWYDGNGANTMGYPKEYTAYHFSFGTSYTEISNSSIALYVMVSSTGKEIYKGVCIGDNLSELEKVTDTAELFIDDMDFLGAKGFYIKTKDITIRGYLDDSNNIENITIYKTK